MAKPLRWATCAACGLWAPHRGRGWCGTCYTYWHRTGRVRPPTLDGPRRCVACGRLLTSARRHGHGACHTCFMVWYHWHRGVTRRPHDPARIAAVAAQRAATAQRQMPLERTESPSGADAPPNATPRPSVAQRAAEGLFCVPLLWLLAALVAGVAHG